MMQPGEMKQTFVKQGLIDVTETELMIRMDYQSFDDYWGPFLGGQGPAPTYAMSLDEVSRARLRDRIRERLPMNADGTISLAARAWAARATVFR